MRMRSATLLACLILLAAGEARAGAMYRADLTATLTVVTPAQDNTFGFATFPGDADADTNEIGMIADANAAAGVVSVARGIQGVDLISGTANGAPVAHADSTATTSGKINLGNLTGSGPPTPPARPLNIMMRLEYSYSILAQADTVNDQAGAFIEIAVDTADFHRLFSDVVAVIPGPGVDAAMGRNTVDFMTTVPANRVQPVFLRTLAFGFADCVLVPPLPPPPPIPDLPAPIPEPSSLLLAGIGALGLPFARCRWRRSAAWRSAAY